MKFDHTFIAIRKRTTLEIFDLALHVMRDYFVPLMILLFVGALPWILLNWWMIGWMIGDGNSSGYGWMMLLLVVAQAQVGTAMMTHYLGQSMFIGKPDIWTSIKAIWKVTFGYYWLHYGLRLLLPLVFFGVLYRLNRFDSDVVQMSITIMVLCTIGSIVIRSFRPYVTKIMVLEQTPWSEKADSPITFGRRSSSLHGAGSSDLVARALLSLIIGIPLVLATYGLLTTCYGWIGFRWRAETMEVGFCWPLALWLVAGFFAIVRFLTYIDLRIRQEGWEVELAIRAEALRMEP